MDENVHEVGRAKLENQPEPKAGMRFSVHASPLMGLAGR